MHKTYPRIPVLLVWLVWIMAGTAGIVIAVGGIFIMSTGIPELNRAQWFVYFALPAFSLLIPLLQWLSVKEYLPPLGFWVGSSLLGGVVGALITSFLADFMYAVLPWRPATVVLAAIFWLSLGTAQCLMMCKTYRLFGLWTLVNLFSGLAFALVIHPNLSDPIELIFAAAVPAVITGLGLILLIQRFEVRKLQTQLQ